MSLSRAEESLKASGDDVVVGRHIYGVLYDVITEGFTEDSMRVMLEEAVKASNTKLVEILTRVEDGLISGIALVEESHIAVHLWVEEGYASVDIYTCGEQSDPWAALAVIRKYLRPREEKLSYVDRSSA